MLPLHDRSDAALPDRLLDAGLSAALLCVLLHSTAAVAVGASAADSEPVAQLQEVVVTANRAGEQDLQKVAIAVTAIDAEKLDRTGQNSLDDITRNVPGISVQDLGGGQNTVVIRGITTDGTPQPTDTETQPTVSVYLDDMPISLAGATPDLRVYDLERVEVVRGPQGTLYGAGAMAGNIRYITRKPDPNSTSGSVEAGTEESKGGDWGYSVRGMLNQPLIDDTLAMRMSAYQGRDPGYITNLADGRKNENREENTQVRAAFRLQNVGPWVIDASYLYGRVKADSTNGTYSDLGPYQYSVLTPELYLDRFHFFNIAADYKNEAFDVISSTSYVDRSIENNQDSSYFAVYATSQIPGGPIASPQAKSVNVIKNDIKDFAQEVRVAVVEQHHLKGQIGVFFEHQKRSFYQNFPTPGFDALYGISSLSLGAFTPDTLFSETQESATQQVAEFGELAYSPMEKLDLTGGLRHFDWRQTFKLYSAGAFGVDPTSGTPLSTHGKSTESGSNPRANITYHVTPDVMTYIEAAKGFRYGGLNQPVPLGAFPGCGADLAQAGLSNVPPTFGPDHLWTYTLGEKSTLLDRRVNLNLTAFYTRWSDVQTRHLLASCSYYYLRNKGDVTSKGVELETKWQVTSALSVSFSAGYTDARASGPIPDIGAGDGARAPYFPKLIASLEGDYRWMTPLGLLLLETDYGHRASATTAFSAADPSYRIIPATNVVNASATLQRQRLELTLFARNLTNERIVTGIAADLYGSFQPGDQIFLGRPLTFGARVGFHF